MKLHELADQAQTKQVAKVMESYFGSTVAFDKLSKSQAKSMLNRVRGLISEHRRDPSFHQSEQNPTYLKLMMMEQGLAAATAVEDPQKMAALATAQQQQKKRQLQDQMREIDDQIKSLQTQKQSVQQQMNSPLAETKLQRRLREASEVQQAQVVLASKDMVDQVQKMIETATSIQFKDLPALVDQIRNEIGYDQATQFNGDATAALSGLVQNLQTSKQQLEGALGVVTGQAPQVPGVTDAELGAPDLDANLGAELPPENDQEELDIDIDAEEEPSSLETTLGRGKR